MSNEIQFNTNPPESSTIYVVIWNAAGQAYNGSAFATYNGTRSTWKQAMTETPSSTGRYLYTFPSVAAGFYRWEIYKQAGGSPSHSNDVRQAIGEGYWDGDAFAEQSASSGGGGGSGGTEWVGEDDVIGRAVVEHWRREAGSE